MHSEKKTFPDGFGVTTSLEQDTINALRECGMSPKKAKELVEQFGTERALILAAKEDFQR